MPSVLEQSLRIIAIPSKKTDSPLIEQISPHVLRHTCAMTILQATGDIRKVSLWLGHAHMQTTEIYLRADPTEKIEAIEGIMPMSLRRGKFNLLPERYHFSAWLE